MLEHERALQERGSAFDPPSQRSTPTTETTTVTTMRAEPQGARQVALAACIRLSLRAIVQAGVPHYACFQYLLFELCNLYTIGWMQEV